MTALNPTHDPARRSWIESANQPDTDFPIQNLPFGAFERDGEPRAGVAIGEHVVDLRALRDSGLVEAGSDAAIACEAAADGTLNRLMAMEPRYASALRAALSDLLKSDAPQRARVDEQVRALLPRVDEVALRLACEVGDYTDFLTSLHHTERHGRYKGLADPLPPAFKSLPIAYHGRASSLRVSGGEVRRPHGQYRDANGQIVFGPAPALDFELECAAWIGRGNALTQPIPIDAAHEHIFGYSLLNDWSAKSIQWFEQVLGPFLGKSFHSSLSPWIVTAEALAPFRKAPVPRAKDDPPLMAHLNGAFDQQHGGLHLELSAHLSTAQLREAGSAPVRITQTHLDNLYWTFAQMVAHHTSNGCNLRTGDLLGSGTISGAADEARACITELTNAGKDPLRLPNGETRTALEDGDEIVLGARATKPGAVSIGFGECRGRIAPAFAFAEQRVETPA
ncbi:fumarylacetoacetase [Paraburkholderia caballeronis]|uniref:fumarylacetoacetase n=1 Tax=Paraburkholderia caballeronis TaxID=416943 RepID=A0A1H7G0M6_9BURK|nr:fumarylacetoacetase [Paraburkholderia caballeronis]PXW24762.1 fumarylacetoacetate hydrolase [Paraburkholderia caballeronis]PXX00492.1 fumarylacetoacetate hydrolase [Paraburkholderia caballeronis]RAJ98555.1 fumarylacetoacetate hydrolase [Paraburkholderia caballeronis]SEE66740.1 fumarylacetoacetate hydrolase [Paraburkholderia caballeronis]SEK31678.1 fumarylacetoacetate hydrolase [Paraburkholderia caballeronis]